MLFNDQYIVKPSHGGDAASFAWHRDSDWCREGSLPQPYISIWVALDDCEIENGCLFLHPGSHAASPEYVHVPGLEPRKVAECKEYNLSDSTTTAIPSERGTGTSIHKVQSTPSSTIEHEVPLLLKAGSAVIMTDVVEHASGANRTQYARRGWMPQFSCQPILWKESNTPVSLAIPLSVKINCKGFQL